MNILEDRKGTGVSLRVCLVCARARICASMCARTSLDCSPWKSPSMWEKSQGEPEDFPDPEPRV